MTPSMLQDELIKELRNIFQPFLYRNSEGKRVPINIFAQNIPIQQTDEEEEPIPYIIVRVRSGSDAGEKNGAHIVSIMYIIGMWDNEESAQGHRDVLNVIQKVYERFSKNASLNGKAVYDGQFDWALQEDNYFPYYFGACSMNFKIEAIRREDELS